MDDRMPIRASSLPVTYDCKVSSTLLALSGRHSELTSNMLTPAALPRKPRPPETESPSTIVATSATTAGRGGMRTNPPLGCSSSACTVTRGESDKEERSVWLGTEEARMGERVLRACDLSPVGALDARAISSKHRVTPLDAIADWRDQQSC